MVKNSKELKLGIFAIIILITTFVIINILRGSDIFGREMSIFGRFDNVEGLVASAPVMVRGYSAGRVSAVEYDPQEDSFLVECSIDKRFRIPADSRMTIYSTSLMGGKGIRIDMGVSDTLVADGSTLLTGSDVDLISSLTGSVAPILEKVGALADSIAKVTANVNMLLDENNRSYINKSLSHLNNTLASARKVASDIERDYSCKSEEISKIVDNLTDLSQKLLPIADSASSTIDGADKTIDTLRNAIVDINNNVDKISDPLNDVLKDVDELINKIKENPKKYLKISVF